MPAYVNFTHIFTDIAELAELARAGDGVVTIGAGELHHHCPDHPEVRPLCAIHARFHWNEVQLRPLVGEAVLVPNAPDLIPDSVQII